MQKKNDDTNMLKLLRFSLKEKARTLNITHTIQSLIYKKKFDEMILPRVNIIEIK